MSMIRVAELFRKVLPSGEVYYSGRLGQAWVVLTKTEKVQLLDPDLLLYISNEDKPQTFNDEF